jgi:hypothetical protein
MRRNRPLDTTWKQAGLGWSLVPRGKIGDRLALAVPVKTAGRYDVIAQFTKAPDYGTIQLYWNGEKLGRTLDAYAQIVSPTGEIKFGTLELPAGESRLELEIVGANEKSQGRLVGLDYLRLVPLIGDGL